LVSHAAEPALRVVCLHTVLTELAVAIGGPDATVVGLVKPGIDPHTFDPSPTDAREIAGADLVLAAGLGLENYLERVARNAGGHAKFVRVGDALPGALNLAPGEPDPHWWNSLVEMLAAVDVIRDQYASLRPARAGGFAERAGGVRRGLREVQAWADTEVARLAPSRRELVTSHDAFGYFARDYGFSLHPLAGVSPEAEPNARELGDLIDLIRRRHIRAVFVESSVNPSLIETIVEETGCKLGGTLYADGLGPGADGTYAAMFRHNLTTIVDALR
jgi:zinc/manganese transport system substrate-binding protein